MLRASIVAQYITWPLVTSPSPPCQSASSSPSHSASNPGVNVPVKYLSLSTQGEDAD